MPRPAIITTQSVLGFLQHAPWSFQPFASNTPTSWTSSTLPEGVTLNGTTGLLEGPADKPGVYVLALQAHNGDGASNQVLFTIGIEASVTDPAGNYVDLILDLGSRDVTPGPSPVIAATADNGGESVIPTGLNTDDAKKLSALGPPRFQGKRGDQLMFRVQFQRNGVAADVDLSELELALKELEPETVLETSSAFYSVGNGIFLVYLELTSDALKGALSNYEGDYGTAFPAVCEFTWLADNPDTANIGPDDIRGSSRTFRADVIRDVTE